MHTVTCAPVTCATPRVTATGDGPGTVWTVSDGGRVAWPGSSGHYTADRGTQPVEDADRPSTAIAATDSGIYAVYRVGSAPSGLHVSVGEQPEYWRWVLWQCPGQVCDQVRRLPWTWPRAGSGRSGWRSAATAGC